MTSYFGRVFTHAGVLAVFKPRRGRLKIPVAPTGKLKLHVFPLHRAKENKGFALWTPTSPFLKGLTPKSMALFQESIRFSTHAVFTLRRAKENKHFGRFFRFGKLNIIERIPLGNCRMYSYTEKAVFSA